MRVDSWVWRECRQCRAPVIRPLPDFWSFTVKTRRTGICMVSTHLPECAMGFKKVVIPDDDE